MSPTPEELYAQREQRFNDIVALRKPDKVPVMPLMMHYSPTRSPASRTLRCRPITSSRRG